MNDILSPGRSICAHGRLRDGSCAAGSLCRSAADCLAVSRLIKGAPETENLMSGDMLGVVLFVVGNVGLFGICIVLGRILSVMTDRVLK